MMDNNILNKLQALAIYLKNINLLKEAQHITELTEEPKEYAEPWHEEVVQELGGEGESEEEYLKRTSHFPLEESDFGLSMSPMEFYDQVLQDNHFQIISTNSQGSIIGEGAFGVVFRGIYQGQVAVAKVIIDQENQNNTGEADLWFRILKRKNQIPSELQRFLPNVFLTRHGFLKAIDYQHLGYDIIVMEQLYPIPASLKNIFMPDYQKKKDLKNFLQPDVLYSISKQFIQFLKQQPELQQIILPEPVELQKLILDKVQNLLPNQRVFGSKFYDFIIEKIEQKIKILNKDPDFNFSTIFNYNYRPFFEQMLSGAKLIPLSYENFENNLDSQQKEVLNQFPELESLFQFFQESSKIGILYNDFHHGNVMINASGQIKIIDVGLYSVK